VVGYVQFNNYTVGFVFVWVMCMHPLHISLFLSEWTNVQSGVPVLGPLLFILYVTEYGKINHFVMREINRTEHFAMLP